MSRPEHQQKRLSGRGDDIRPFCQLVGGTASPALLDAFSGTITRAFETTPEQGLNPRDIANLLQNPHVYGVYLPTSDGADALVAVAALVQLLAPDAELITLAVDPGQRRQGLARRGLGACLNLAARHGCRRLLLDVRADNVAARRLYEQAGAHVIGQRRAYYCLRDGGRADALVMEIAVEARRE